MATAIATVASLEGQAWAKAPDGTLRPLKVGDAVTADEVVITAQGAHIELDFGDGHPVTIAGGQEVAMNSDLWTDLAADNKDAAVDNASVQEALTVLNNGGDLTTTLEETAAGLSGGGSNEGHSFVELSRVVEETDPNAFNFGIANGDTASAPVPLTSFASLNNAPVLGDQSFGGNEDTIISGRVIATDVENNALTYSLVSQPANGSLTLDPTTGDFVFTPNGNYNGPDSFIVTVTDDRGNSTTSTVNLTVTSVNDAPLSSNQNLTTLEDTSVSGQVVATDIDGDALTYSISTTATNGTVTLDPATGGFVYTPNANYNGPDSFAVTVSDGNGGTTTSVISIGVTPVNDGPLSSNQNLTTPEDTPISGSIVATDIDGDTLTFSVTSPAANGTVAINAAGGFVYTPGANFNGADSFVVTIADGQGGFTTSTVNIGVTPVNDAPSTGNQNLTTPEDTPVSGQVVATDVEGDTLSYSISTTAAHGTVTLNPATGGFVYTPGAGYNGADQFVVSVSDGNGGVSTSLINIGVTPVNDAPVSVNQNLTTLEDTAVSGQVIATDADGDALTYSLGSNAANGSVTLNAITGGFIYTPNSNYNGSDSFTVTINDGNGGVTTSVISVGVTPVNDTPSATNQNLSTPENTPVSGAVSASDADGDTLAYSLTGVPAHGTVALNSATGGFIYTPTTGYNGGDSFVVTVNDGKGGTTTSTVTVGVQPLAPVNSAPAAVGDSASTAQDTAVTVAVRANDTDADGDALTVSAVTQGANGSVVIDGVTGNPVYTPNTGYVGNDSFTYTVNDGNGGTSSATVNITVNAVVPGNIAPVTVADAITVAEGGTATILTGGATSLLANDSDANGDPLTAVLVTGPVNGTLTLNANGTFSYTHNGSETTIDSFTYRANDGTVNGNIVTVNIGIAPDNDAPVANPDTTITNEDTAVTIPVRINDTDAEGNALTVSGVTQGANGSVVIDGVTGNPIYTPNTGFVGSDSFTYTISDGQGGSSIGTVSITVNGVNHAPVAVADSFTVAEGGTATTLTGGAASVLTNDTDLDGNPLTASLVSGPANGTLVFNSNGTFSYTHNGSETTTDSFTYKVNDGTVDGNTVTVNIGVTPVNDAPVTTVDSISVAEGGTATVLVGGATSVLANDSDPENDTLSAILVTGPAHGTLTLNANGTFSYTHDGSETTVDSFTYKANDGSLDGNLVTVNIGVTPVDDPSVLLADSKSVQENTTATGNVLANDSDIDSALSVASFDVSGASYSAGQTATLAGIGTFTLGSNGDYSFTPDTGWNGTAPQITYTTNTGSSTTLDITITHTNVAPETAVVSASGDEDTIITVTLSGSDSDGTLAGYVINSLPANGVLYSDATLTQAIAAGDLVGGTVYFDPTANWNGSTNFSYFAQDNLGLVDGSPATASIIVNPVIDTTTVSLTASSSVAEGGAIVYTATLSDPAQSPVTLNLSNGSFITIATGATTGTVSVAAPGDDVYLDSGSVSVTISSAIGGGFENLAINPAAAITTVSDTLDTTTVSLTASATVAEGGSIVYTATLTNAAQGAVTVNLSNGSVITIADGATVGSVSVAAPADDAYVDAGSISVTINTASGGNFENLAINPTAAVTNLTDMIDATTLSLSASSSVAEGGSITYTATLSNPAQGAVTVNLSNGSVITIANGATTGTVSVTAPADDVYLDAGSVSATITGATGGNFEDLIINNAIPTTTTITDTADTVTLSLTGTASISEGSSGSYTLSLTHPAQTAVTVTLNYTGVAANGADITGQTTVTIPANANSANFSIGALTDGLVEGTESFTVSIGSATGGNFENLAVSGTANSVTTNILDANTATLSLSATPGLTEAGGILVYTATITSAPVTNLVVSLSNGETITILAGQTSGTTSTLVAGSDDVYLDSSTVSATITGASGGGINVAINPAAAITAITDTIDTTNVTLSAAANVNEGGSVVYTATVDNQVTLNPLIIHLTNGVDITIPVGATSATSNAVAVRADDAYAQGNQSLTVGISSTSGGNFEALNTTSTATTVVHDNGSVTTVTLSSAASVNEGGSLVYTASLGSAVTGTPLTIHLSNGTDIVIPVGATSATSAAVLVRADDVYAQGTQSVVVGITGTSGGNYESLNTSSTTSTLVNDDSDATSVTLSAAASVNEGGSLIYTATVGNPVTGSPLVIQLSNGASITIPVGSSSATSAAIPVRVDDAYVQGNQSVTVGISSTSGGNYEALDTTSTATTVVSDNANTTSISLTATSNVVEGGSIVYTATLGAAVTGSPLTIHLSNGTDITIPVGAISANSAAVLVRGDDVYIQGNQFVTVGISSTSGGNFEALDTSGTVTSVVKDDADVTTVSLSATNSVAEGGTIVYTATLSNPAHGAVTLTLSNGAVITIADNATTGSVSIAAHANNVYVDAATVSTTIVSATGGNFEAVSVSPTPATTSVTDTIDVTTLSISGVASIREGSSGAYTLSLDHPTLTALTVTLNYSGVAANGTDINGATTVTIPAGSSSTSFNIAALNDVLTEGNENFTVSIGSTSGGGFESLVVNGTANSVTTTVIDNRAPDAVNDSVSGASSNVGLVSEYYGVESSTYLTNVAQMYGLINSRTPDATFTATTFNYGANTNFSNNLGTGTNLQAFLGSDAASLSNDPAPDFRGSLIHMKGFVQLNAGTYNFRVLSDDGYEIRVDGVAVAQVNGNQSATTTTHSTFTVPANGLHSIEIVYWDQGGLARFKLELSGDSGASYNILSSVPTYKAAGFAVAEDTPTSFSTASLLANDTDPDGDTLTITSVQAATNGTVSLVGSNVLFTPNANYSGPATFTYTVSDGHGGTDTAVVNLNVTAVNDAPVAGSDILITQTGTAVTVAASTLLANDVDVDGDAIYLTAVSGGVNGSVSLSNGSVTFTPNAGFNGIASFNYTVTDNHNGFGTGKVTVEVANVLGTSGDNTSLVGNLTTGNTIAGLGGNDKLTGNTGADLLDGGSGNDTMTGGAGADTFVWHLGDRGTTASPALDTISDFSKGAGGDKLDLRDLLQSENSGNLTNYLHFTSDGTSTTISISSTGAFTGSNYGTATDQSIVLTNVNLTGGDTAIINLLKNTNNLITD